MQEEDDQGQRKLVRVSMETKQNGDVETRSLNHSKPQSQSQQPQNIQVLCMNGGEGDKSYAKNSSIQKEVILRMKPILEETVVELICKNGFQDCIYVADMGCSSGPNTFLPSLEIIETIEKTCRRLNRNPPPALQVFLIDLPTNDFNTVFKLLPSFYERVEEEKGDKRFPCFIAAVAGSFHGRLFPPNSLHFIHSSWSLHWLSQMPKDLHNKGNIYITKSSPPSVHKAYLAQFEKDFSGFLRSRSKEMKPGGCMVLALLGGAKGGFTVEHGPCNWQLTAMVLNDMVSEGLIEESKLDSFNMPVYTPSMEELRSIIENQGSFEIQRLDKFVLSWEADINNGLVLDKYAKGKHVADRVRAVGESLLSSHFGAENMDQVFDRFSIKAADYMEMGKGAYTTLVVSLCFEG